MGRMLIIHFTVTANLTKIKKNRAQVLDIMHNENV